MRVRLVFLALGVAAVRPATAQLPEPADSGWTVYASAAADLWFHGMAVAGLYDPDRPFPLYDSGYVNRIQALKREQGVTSRLDSLAAEIRREFLRNSSPGIFHFVPLYFARTPPARMLSGLTAMADQRVRDTILGRPDVRLGAMAVAGQLQERDLRRLLLRFVSALEDEWARFYEAYWEEWQRAEADRYAEIREMWRGLSPALAPFLSRARLEGGVLLPSPALGLEGRIDEGDGFNGQDNVVAVWLPSGEHGADRSTFAALKELCFVLVNRVPMPRESSAGEQELMRANAAVRCGHLLLEFYAPTIVTRYRRVFLEVAGAPNPGRPVETFERRYPLPREVYEALREEIRRR